MTRKGDGITELPKRRGKRWWRARIYWVDERTGREREQRATFQADSRALAMLERDRRLEAAKTGVEPQSRDRKRFGEVAWEWHETLTRYGTKRAWKVHTKKLCARYGDAYLDKLSERELQDYIDSAPGSAGYVNSTLDVLRHVFAHAVRKGYIQVNTAKHLERRTTRKLTLEELEAAPQRALTDVEAVRYLAYLSEHEAAVYPVIATQFYTGMRFAEASALEWRDIDFDRGIITVRRGQVCGRVGPTKGQHARTAGIGPALRQLLEAHRAEMAVEQWPGWETLVFPRPYSHRKRRSHYWVTSTVIYICRRSLVACGLGHIRSTTHAARHTAITLASQFAAEAVLRKVVGHATAQVHQRYQGTHEAQVVELATGLERALQPGALPAHPSRAATAKPKNKPLRARSGK